MYTQFFGQENTSMGVSKTIVLFFNTVLYVEETLMAFLGRPKVFHGLHKFPWLIGITNLFTMYF